MVCGESTLIMQLCSFYILITFASRSTSFTVTLLPSVIDVVEYGSENLTCYSSDISNTIQSSGWKYSMLPDKTSSIYLLDSTCTAGGYIYENPALYAWSCPEANKFVLTLLNMTLSAHNTSWACRLGFSFSNNVEVFVKVPVKSVKMKSHTHDHVTVMENAVIRFECQTSCSRPEPNVFWFLRSQDQRILNVTNESRQSYIACGKAGFTEVTSVLDYTLNRTFQGWSIYCLAANLPGRNVTTVKKRINVLFPPDGPPIITGIENESKYRVAEHEKANLSCTVSGGNPLANIVWLCFNGTVSEFKGTDTVTSTVTWIAFRNQQEQSCVCVAEHIFGNRNISVTVEVMYKASVLQFYIGEVSTTAESFTVSEKENVTFSCNFESKPPPKATISRDGRIIYVSVSNNTVVYTKKNIQCLDLGTYICSGMNEYNNGKPSAKNLTLRVNCSPRPSPFIELMEEVNSPRYTSSTLIFSALAFPEPGFTWYFLNGSERIMLTDSRNIIISSSSSQTFLTIKNVTESDYGEYLLLISNPFGVYEQKFNIDPHITSVSTTVPNIVATAPRTVTFVAVGVGTFVAALILFGSALFVYRFIRRRRKLLHNVHKDNRRNTEKTSSATEDNNVAEYEQISMKPTETKTSVSDKRETVPCNESTHQYERLDKNQRETGQYSQLPALYEQMETSKENTESEYFDSKGTRHDIENYINVRI